MINDQKCPNIMIAWSGGRFYTRPPNGEFYMINVLENQLLSVTSDLV